MKCRMFALSLALGALLCLAPSVAALEPQPEAPAPDTAAASQTDTPAAPAEEAAPDAAEPAGQALTEEVTKEVTVTVEVPILPEKPPIQISYTTPEEIGFAWEEDGLELEVAEVRPVEEISVGDVLRALEGNLDPVECPGIEHQGGCDGSDVCVTKYGSMTVLTRL